MDFQDVIMTLDRFWVDQGCVLWHPYNVQVGAGTANPATVLRVLGPESWNVAYIEPSVRPDDGRYGENPNRWQQFYQYQVILKPDPGNPQELYLDSLRAVGVDTAAHDVRFVEDNWESPALGAWGLGWEVWMDGQEISQYTYFQQAGGQNLDPVSVELTYGLERIAMVLQGVRGFNDIRWTEGVTYGDIWLKNEVEACTYNFQVADVDNLRQMYDLCEAEAKNALKRGLVMPAHDYGLKCSHLFNVLDARGAVGVTERARYFVRMRDLAREVSDLYSAQRDELGYPLNATLQVAVSALPPLRKPVQPDGDGPHDLLLEIGSEELPVGDLDAALAQLRDEMSDMLSDVRLEYDSLQVMGTPRRQVALVRGLASRQADQTSTVRGPAATIAYDANGHPTKAALGFARGRGVDVSELQRQDIDGREYVVAVLTEQGRAASDVLSERLPEAIGAIRFGRSMRWNASGISYSRPLRWYVALLDDEVIPFEYAGVRSDRTSRGIRTEGSPELTVSKAGEYVQDMVAAGILLDVAAREASVVKQARALAEEVGGELVDDAGLVREVANLVEFPLAVRGTFSSEYLRLPDSVLLAIMRKHQRYLPVVSQGKLLPYFITIGNGATLDVDAVRFGNEEVLRARYADATFFYDADAKRSLESYTARLSTLTFQEELGSVLDKVHRLELLVPDLGPLLGLDAEETRASARAASLCKSDLVTQLVVELTSLQGQMGRHYAELSGESTDVALAIEEHYLPRFTGDRIPEGMPGVAVGLADRLDTLVGLFSVGVRPTGAADPWGLRRSAMGVIQILLTKSLSLSLSQALSLSAARLPVESSGEMLGQVHDFVLRRFQGYLQDQGYRYDKVEAVLAAQGDDTCSAVEALQELATWAAREEWQELLDTYARCVRITRDLGETLEIHPERFVEPSAKALHDTYVLAASTVGANPSVETLFAALETMMPAIRRFFDDVLVMDKDPVLKQNRLALLQAIGSLTEGIVDLTVMEGF